MTTAPSSVQAGLPRHGVHWPWHRQLPAPVAVARREKAESPLATLCVIVSVFTMWVAALVAFLWIAVHLEAPPVDPTSFDRWWFLPATLFASCVVLGAEAFRRTGQRSAGVVGLISVAGLVGVLAFCPYF